MKEKYKNPFFHFTAYLGMFYSYFPLLRSTLVRARGTEKRISNSGITESSTTKGRSRYAVSPTDASSFRHSMVTAI